jgi:hypothetical protein
MLLYFRQLRWFKNGKLPGLRNNAGKLSSKLFPHPSYISREHVVSRRALAEMETDADILAHEKEEVATEVTGSISIKEPGSTDVDMTISVEQSGS